MDEKIILPFIRPHGESIQVLWGKYDPFEIYGAAG
jgi:hypothetical protein